MTDVLASDQARLLVQSRIRGARTAGYRLQNVRGKQRLVLRNGRPKVRRRTMGTQCPRKAALAGYLGRCRARRWIHRAASGKDLGRQNLRMDSLYPIPLVLPRGAISVAPFRVLRL